MAVSRQDTKPWFIRHSNGRSFVQASREGRIIVVALWIALMSVWLMPLVLGGFTYRLYGIQVGLSAAMVLAFLWTAWRHSSSAQVSETARLH